MFAVGFGYADHRVKGYEQFGAAKDIKASFATKREAWNWIREVERHAEANDKIRLDEVVVMEDGNVIYQAEYNRHQFRWLYDHIDCHGGVWRFVR